MAKKGAISAFLVFIILFFSLLFYEIIISQINLDRINKLNITMHKVGIKYEGHDAINLNIKISGDLPRAESEFIVFADNRYLEFVPNAFSNSPGVVFSGQNAGGAEADFLITDNSNDINLVYFLKHPTESPLIYAGIKSTANSIILDDHVISSKYFILSD